MPGRALYIVAFDIHSCAQVLDAVGEPPGVDAARVAAINRFVRREDQLRAWAGELAARWMMSYSLNVRPDKLVFQRDKNGRPHLPGSTLDYNVSHSGEWAVCARAEGAVGIDIEQHQPVDWKVCRICFTPGERALLDAAADDDARSRLFFRLWTLKESYIKARGLGMQIDLQSFGMQPQGQTWGPAYSAHGDEQKWIWQTPEFEKGYSLAVCRSSEAGAAEEAAPGVQRLRVEQILQFVYYVD